MLERGAAVLGPRQHQDTEASHTFSYVPRYTFPLERPGPLYSCPKKGQLDPYRRIPCAPANALNHPSPLLISASQPPDSTRRPLSSTWMMSAPRMADSRCVMISMVIRPWSSSMASWIRLSFSESRALVPRRGSARTGRATAPRPGPAAAALLRRAVSRGRPGLSPGPRVDPRDKPLCGG